MKMQNFFGDLDWVNPIPGGKRRMRAMEWQTVIMYGAAALVALAALKFTWDISLTGWSWVGAMATTIAVALQIAPGMYSGDKAVMQLRNGTQDMSAKQVDHYREKIRRDIIARAVIHEEYPQQTERVNNWMRRG